MKVILDSGHGIGTAGKRSPIWGDGSQLMEWEFNRDIVSRVYHDLLAQGVEAAMIVVADEDMSLGERCRRVNDIAKQVGNDNCFLVSIHANAGGGTGWECFTSVGETKSDAIAEVFCKEAEKAFPEFRMRFDHTDGDMDKESQFYILKNTTCPAILTENFFMDTERDCRFIMSEDGRERIAQMHIDAILKCIN